MIKTIKVKDGRKYIEEETTTVKEVFEDELDTETEMLEQEIAMFQGQLDHAVEELVKHKEKLKLFK